MPEAKVTAALSNQVRAAAAVAVHDLLREFGVDAEHRLGGCVFHHRDGLLGIAIQPSGHALGVQDDLYGTDNDATGKGHRKNPP